MDPFVAEIRIFGFNFAPTGWAFCNGQLLPLSQNTALFALLGTFYGGDGKSTFALPNMQDNAPMQRVRTVALVEDQADARRMMQFLLEAQGVKVFTAKKAARLAMTPTTAAVMPVRAAERVWFPRRRST
mgnify:CR=1 FL=1